MSAHELKTDSDVFKAVQRGLKTYEIRFNDRNFQEGDTLLLRETVFTGQQMRDGALLRYTGMAIKATVSHVLHGPSYGLKEGWVILSLHPRSVRVYEGGTHV